MKATRAYRTIDTHTGGNPTRTVISGLPQLEGATMADKMLDMKNLHDGVRRLLMNEPRGHEVMSGACLVAPCHPDADVGVIFIETGGYLPMCGHDTIGFCTALVECGLVPVREPITVIRLDTPAGLVTAEVAVINGTAISVTFRNVPAFLHSMVNVYVPQLGEVQCDIAYGGNFYAIVDARRLGLPLEPSNAAEIVDKAVRIRKEINRVVVVEHPEFPHIRGVTHVEFYSDPVHQDSDLRNAVVVPPGGIDRSPCGTGTSAKLAALYAQGAIGLNKPFVHESIVGSVFRGRVLEQTKVGSLPAVVTEITGSAWLMGMHTFYSDEEDPLNEGFLFVPQDEH
ncbi:proline racemase [Cohnella endophytica]|uniref:Proline racemase n=1 Tax=Cohnella endophytica TaxID=2419778 RepID=A0A494Y113_9BACL|nr:proline racemase family protein [Cohnella endophytica]RKP54107.1 proline racemase [Cohnella endophytica]